MLKRPLLTAKNEHSKRSVQFMSELQTANPLIILQPLIVLLISCGLVVYWRYRRSFTKAVFLYSLVAYAGAIGLKYLVQIPTAAWVVSLFGATSLVFGLYLGVQTVVFEVGGAFLVAKYAVSKASFESRDAEAYGIALAFWENGVLLGALPLINLIVSYVLLTSNMPGTLSSQISNSQPAFFYLPAQILPLIAWGTLERISSLLAHFSWGYLTVLAAAFHKWRFLVIALPMGLLDALVPFAKVMPLSVFELLVFSITLGFLLVSLAVTWTIRKQATWSPT
jgi:hypothetical protein